LLINSDDDNVTKGNPQTLRRRKGAAPAAHHPEHDTVAGWHGGAKGPSSRKVAGLTTVSLPPGNDCTEAEIAADWECRPLHSAVIGVRVWVPVLCIVGAQWLSTGATHHHP